MEENEIYILARFSTQAALDKALYYVQEDTRPDFDDDVPENESSFFEAVDEKSFPTVIKKLPNNAVYFEFTSDEDDLGMIQCEKLGADFTLSIYREEYDGKDDTIYLAEQGREIQLIYATRFYDEPVMDEKVESFQQELNRLTGLELIQFVLDYLEQHKALPFTPD